MKENFNYFVKELLKIQEVKEKIKKFSPIKYIVTKIFKLFDIFF